MKQDINLYLPRLRPREVVLPASMLARLGALLLLTLAVLSAWTYAGLQPVRERAARAQAAAESAAERLAAGRARYLPRAPDARLTAELAQRQGVLLQTRAVTTRLKAGAYGTTAGLSAFLAGLARQHVEGTWLTGVRIAEGGSAVGLDGRTLLPELVPAYLARLSAEPAFEGKTFSNLALSTAADDLGEIAFHVQTPGLAAATSTAAVR